ncbi:hypothetical protein E4T63_13845 [Pseudomonas fluorescens]|uniref:Uncharacterized protein n=1 Tax=Pseudomonas fluorescens TaxID=294 RepID=A0AAP8YXX4_PSEFL|nr:hypothetical protein E4T63_13845 [Pseudomonas fluorescens]
MSLFQNARVSLAILTGSRSAVNLTHRKSVWERACSRRGRHIQHRYQRAHRLREQARSHRGDWRCYQ